MKPIYINVKNRLTYFDREDNQRSSEYYLFLFVLLCGSLLINRCQMYILGECSLIFGPCITAKQADSNMRVNLCIALAQLLVPKSKITTSNEKKLHSITVLAAANQPPFWVEIKVAT